MLQILQENFSTILVAVLLFLGVEGTRGYMEERKSEKEYLSNDDMKNPFRYVASSQSKTNAFNKKR